MKIFIIICLIFIKVNGLNKVYCPAIGGTCESICGNSDAVVNKNYTTGCEADEFCCLPANLLDCDYRGLSLSWSTCEDIFSCTHEWPLAFPIDGYCDNDNLVCCINYDDDTELPPNPECVENKKYWQNNYRQFRVKRGICGTAEEYFNKEINLGKYNKLLDASMIAYLNRNYLDLTENADIDFRLAYALEFLDKRCDNQKIDDDFPYFTIDTLSSLILYNQGSNGSEKCEKE